jgi:hypothetical protein
VCRARRSAISWLVVTTTLQRAMSASPGRRDEAVGRDAERDARKPLAAAGDGGGEAAGRGHYTLAPDRLVATGEVKAAGRGHHTLAPDRLLATGEVKAAGRVAPTLAPGRLGAAAHVRTDRTGFAA